MLTFFRNCIYTKTQQLNHAAMNFDLAEVTRLLSGIDKAGVSWETLEMALGAATTIKIAASRDETLQDEKIIPILLLLCKELAQVPGFDWDIIAVKVGENLLHSCDNLNRKLCIKISRMLQEQQVNEEGSEIKPAINFNSLRVLPALKAIYNDKRRTFGNDALIELPPTLSLISQLLIMVYDELHILNGQAIIDVAPGIRSHTSRTLAANTYQLEVSAQQKEFLVALSSHLTIHSSEVDLLKTMGRGLALWSNISPDLWASKGACISLTKNSGEKESLPLYTVVVPTRASLAMAPRWMTQSGRTGGGTLNPAYGVR